MQFTLNTSGVTGLLKESALVWTPQEYHQEKYDIATTPSVHSAGPEFDENANIGELL